jgi:hypothetical protein
MSLPPLVPPLHEALGEASNKIVEQYESKDIGDL